MPSLILIALFSALKGVVCCCRPSQPIVINFNLWILVSFQVAQHTCVHAYSMSMQTAHICVSLQATYKWTCCSAVMCCHSCLIISSLDRFLLPLPLRVCQWVTRWCAWVCLIVVQAHVYDNNGAKYDAIFILIFLIGRHLFQTSLKFAYGDSDGISCKTAVIIGNFSSGTELERKRSCTCVCMRVQIWTYV